MQEGVSLRAPDGMYGQLVSWRMLQSLSVIVEQHCVMHFEGDSPTRADHGGPQGVSSGDDSVMRDESSGSKQKAREGEARPTDTIRYDAVRTGANRL